MLEFDSRHFDTVELNHTFYRLPLETGAGGCFKRVELPGARLGHRRVPGRYSRLTLSRCADRNSEWRRELKAVYLYFDDDQAACAVENALALKALLD